MNTALDSEPKRIMVWLPSPLGDAVLCTPALRALRTAYPQAQVVFCANPTVRQVLSPTQLCDHWIDQAESGIFEMARALRREGFTHAVLMKNSFGSALACRMAAIPRRIGYARDGRGWLLTDRLRPLRDGGRFERQSMLDYYLSIAEYLGCDRRDRSMELEVDPKDRQDLAARLPELAAAAGPVVTLVPGGAFGPSKCWPAERFAQTADWLVARTKALIVVSVSPIAEEQLIADRICSLSHHPLVHLGRRALTLGQLKALLAGTDLVITNDTGPRHMAIALKRNVITLFGPNDPAWTQTGWPAEIQLIGKAPCAPCSRPVCKASRLFCMESITVEEVCQAAEKVLG